MLILEINFEHANVKMGNIQPNFPFNLLTFCFVQKFITQKEFLVY